MSKTLAIILGTIFILLGLLGFVSNSFVGENALFITNEATNWLHLVFGIAIFIAGIR